MRPVKTSIDDPIAVDFMEPDVIQAPGRIGMSIAPRKNDEDGEAIWKRDLEADLRWIRTIIKQTFEVNGMRVQWQMAVTNKNIYDY